MLWVGGGATLAVYAILTQPQNTPEEMASVARKAALIGERMFTPLSLLTLAFGFGLMENAQSPWTPDPVDRPDRRGRAARGRLCDDREAVPLAHKADELRRP